MNISMIAAIGKNNELGINGNLIWRFKGDMKFFKETTMGHVVVMGKNTFLSHPKVLPGRKNIVLTKSNIDNKDIEIYRSIKEFLDSYKDFNDEIFIIGGASIYNEFIEYAKKMYLTEIDMNEPNADVFYPNFNKDEWEQEALGTNEESNIKYKHVLYKRK